MPHNSPDPELVIGQVFFNYYFCEMFVVAVSFPLGKYNLLKPKLLMGADLTNFSVQNHFLQGEALKLLKQARLYFLNKKCFDLGFKIS